MSMQKQQQHMTSTGVRGVSTELIYGMSALRKFWGLRSPSSVDLFWWYCLQQEIINYAP